MTSFDQSPNNTMNSTEWIPTMLGWIRMSDEPSPPLPPPPPQKQPWNWAAILNGVADIANAGLKAYNNSQQQQRPQGMNNTIIHPRMEALSPVKLSPMGNPIPSFDPRTLEPITSQIRANALPQSNPLSKMRGNNLPKAITANPNTHPGEVRSWIDHSPEELKAMLQAGKPMPLPPQNFPQPYAPSISRLIPESFYGYNTPAASPWSASPERFQQSLPHREHIRSDWLRDHHASRGGNKMLRAYNIQQAERKQQLLEYLTLSVMIRNKGAVWPEDGPQIRLLTNELLEGNKKLYQAIVKNNGLLDANGVYTNRKLTWPQLADITDFVAMNTASDEEFKIQMWLLFGTNVGAPINNYINEHNIGLPVQYHNTGGRAQEQFHHYLGGIIGDFHNSHHLNNPLVAFISEIPEIWQHGQFNKGDVALFNASQKHKDDFVHYGRFTVGRNMRKLMKN